MIGYTRVSTDEQAKNGAGLEAQKAAITAEAKRRGWNMRWWITDDESAKDMKRPGIQEALDLLKAGEADGIAVSKLDRLSRSLLDFAELMARAQRENWKLVALDLGVDTSTPSGEMMANVMASFAQFERRLIGQRTKDALAIRRKQGVRLGRPIVLPREVRRWIKLERRTGRTYQAIANALNNSRTRPAHGGVRWYPATVRAVERRAAR